MFRSKIATIMVSLWAGISVPFFVTPVVAQSAIEGAAPHPMVPLPADGMITHDVFTDFAVLEFPASPGDRRNAFEQTVAVEGEYRQMEYTVEGLELSLIRLYRGYLQHFESNDFEIIFSGIGEELSIRDGFTFISYESGFLSRTPSTSPDSNAYILVRSPDEQTVIAVSFFSRQNARRMMINAVEIEDMAPLDMFAEEPEAEVTEEEREEVVLVQQDVTELASGLVQDGRVIVNAILFEFDSSEILPDSAEALATVADLMTGQDQLKLLVVGHTDGVGSFDYNVRLSVERAQSVVEWLNARHGIADTRLRAAGAGPMSPMTTNRTEQGRLLNRRVELVEMID